MNAWKNEKLLIQTSSKVTLMPSMTGPGVVMIECCNLWPTDIELARSTDIMAYHAGVAANHFIERMVNERT